MGFMHEFAVSTDVADTNLSAPAISAAAVRVPGGDRDSGSSREAFRETFQTGNARAGADIGVYRVDQGVDLSRRARRRVLGERARHGTHRRASGRCHKKRRRSSRAYANGSATQRRRGGCPTSPSRIGPQGAWP